MSERGRRARAQHSRMMLEPAGLGRAPRGPVLFTPERERNVGQAEISREIPALPDDLLVATLVELGCPRWFAEQLRRHPGLRFNAVATWCLVQDAREGASVQNARTGEWSSARDLVDAIREQYADARRQELINDVPGHTAGFGER